MGSNSCECPTLRKDCRILREAVHALPKRNVQLFPQTASHLNARIDLVNVELRRPMECLLFLFLSPSIYCSLCPSTHAPSTHAPSAYAHAIPTVCPGKITWDVCGLGIMFLSVCATSVYCIGEQSRAEQSNKTTDICKENSDHQSSCLALLTFPIVLTLEWLSRMAV